jgi:hypothetical protein
MVQKRWAVVALACVLAGCASPKNWQKEEISYEGAKSALAECKYQIGLNKVPSGDREELVVHCMEGKGFRWR